MIMAKEAMPKPRDMRNDPAGVSYFFVKVDGLELGSFATCEGLQAEYTFEDITEGGNSDFVYRLPGRIKYGNIKLTRALSPESNVVIEWFTKYNKSRAFGAESITRSTAVIHMFNITGDPIFSWTLKDVHPIKWTGPNFSAEANGVAKETLELAFHGFDWKEIKGKG
jgi:phage tail-like protein